MMDAIFSRSRQIIQGRTLGVLVTLNCLMVACQANDKAGSELMLTKAVIDGQTLQLYSDQNMCAIKTNEKGAGQLLSIPYPCGFVRAGKEEVVQTHHYNGIGHVLVVAGPPADETAYTDDVGVSPEHTCSNHGQAVILHEGETTLRKAQEIPLGFCHHLGFDEKVFYGYAYPVD